ncbi:Vacuolar protein-sorting-associated protein 28 [Mortierella sp. NVP85]|nr:Vacuolar protein-sorting-associated protein 28 [Mortierella sp. NVP85]
MPISTTIPSILPAASLLRLKELEDKIAFRYSQDRIDQGLDQDGNEIEDPELERFKAGENEQAYQANMQWLLNLLVKLEEVAPPEEQDDDEERSEQSMKNGGHIKPAVAGARSQNAEYRERHELLTERVASCLTHFCGRTASGAMTRTWTYKTNPPQSLQIHDPSFIGGDVGFKTFGAAYLLSKHIAHGDIPQLESWTPSSESRSSLPLPRILELGSGTGLVGLAATLFSNPQGPKVILSDYHPNVLTTLHFNSSLNHLDSRCDIQLLDWRDILRKRNLRWGLKQPGQEAAPEGSHQQQPTRLDSVQEMSETDRMDLILGAEVVYDPGHAELVAHVVDEYLKKDLISDNKEIPLTRRRPAFHIMFPIRKTHTAVIAEFDYWMDKMGFVDCRQAKEWGREDGETLFLYYWREYVRKEHLDGC